MRVTAPINPTPSINGANFPSLSHLIPLRMLKTTIGIEINNPITLTSFFPFPFAQRALFAPRILQPVTWAAVARYGLGNKAK